MDRTPNTFPTPRNRSCKVQRRSPLPSISFGNSTEIWDAMLARKETYRRVVRYIDQHPAMNSSMRSILIEWLIDVCANFNLLRETFCFCVDYIDRYLSLTRDVEKSQLQLIGITCLFIASKIEEVFPPKVSELAFVTDGACTEDAILAKELVIMQTLDWYLHPVTANKWLAVFMQLHAMYNVQHGCHNKTDDDTKENQCRNVENQSTCPNSCASSPNNQQQRKTDDNQCNCSVGTNGNDGDLMLTPKYSAELFLQVSRLIDLCMLDFEFVKFDYDVIAASALYHFTSEKIIYHCTRLRLNDIRECVLWLKPFAMVIGESPFEVPKNDFDPNMQYYSVDLALLGKAHRVQEELLEQFIANVLPSPVSSPATKVFLKGKRRHDASDDDDDTGDIHLTQSCSSSNLPTSNETQSTRKKTTTKRIRTSR